MDNNFDVLVEKLCKADCTAGATGVRQRAAQDKFSDLKQCLTNLKTKSYLLQALESNEVPEGDQGLKALKKEIHLVKKQTQELRDSIEDKAFVAEQNVQPDVLAEYLALKNEVIQKIAEVRKTSAELGVEVQGSGADDWDWHSQSLLNNYELKAEEQGVQQLEETLRDQNAKNEKLEAELAALREEINKADESASSPSSESEWYKDTIAVMQDLTGIDDIRASNQKLHVTFSNSEEASENSERLQLTISFNLSARGEVTVSASSNVPELDLSEIISNSVAKNDLPYLIRNVKKMWDSYASLHHEISSLRDKNCNHID